MKKGWVLIVLSGVLMVLSGCGKLIGHQDVTYTRGNVEKRGNKVVWPDGSFLSEGSINFTFHKNGTVDYYTENLVKQPKYSYDAVYGKGTYKISGNDVTVRFKSAKELSYTTGDEKATTKPCHTSVIKFTIGKDNELLAGDNVKKYGVDYKPLKPKLKQQLQLKKLYSKNLASTRKQLNKDMARRKALEKKMEADVDAYTKKSDANIAKSKEARKSGDINAMLEADRANAEASSAATAQFSEDMYTEQTGNY